MVNFITRTVSTDSVGFGNLGPDQEQEKNENLRPSRTVRSLDLAVHESLFEIGFPASGICHRFALIENL